jgi:ATP-dependent Clp protease ATP-binding subunit ClpC
VPHFLADKRILALDISLIVAGTKYRGQFEERLKAIMKELTENPNIIVFIDELHTLVGAGRRKGRSTRRTSSSRRCRAARSAASAPRRRGVPEVHREGPLARAPLPGDQGRSARREGNDRDPDGREGPLRAVPSRRIHARGDRGAVYQSSRYITDRFLPDKAIDLVDEAGARAKLKEAGYSEEFGEINKSIRVAVEQMGRAGVREGLRAGAAAEGAGAAAPRHAR